MDLSAWEPSQCAGQLEPVEYAMLEMLVRNGPVSPALDYLAKPRGTWLVVPGIRGSLLLTANSRIDLLKSHAGIDILAIYPAGQQPTKLADAWTWGNFLIAAEACHKGGKSVRPAARRHHRRCRLDRRALLVFGAELVDSNGNITINSDAVDQVLEYAKRLSQFLPPDVGAWDNASNNKFLVSGKGALIFNPQARGRSPNATTLTLPSN